MNALEKKRREHEIAVNKHNTAVARGDQWQAGFQAAVIAHLDRELDEMERVEREFNQQAEAQYAAYVAQYCERGEFESDYCACECDPLGFGDELEAGMPYPHGMRL